MLVVKDRGKNRKNSFILVIKKKDQRNRKKIL